VWVVKHRPSKLRGVNQRTFFAHWHAQRTVDFMTGTRSDLPAAVDDDGRPVDLRATPTPTARPDPVPAVRVGPRTDSEELTDALARVAVASSGVDRGDWTAVPAPGKRGQLATSGAGKIVARVVIGVLGAALFIPIFALLLGVLNGVTPQP
jgi:hypothetical protein